MAIAHSIMLSTPNAALEKHARFWDKKNKGYITPVDAILGFVNLGYSIVFSVTIGTFLSVLFSIFSQDTWLLDPLFRTNINHLQTKTHNSPYDQDGNFDPELFDDLFSTYSKSDIGGKTITLKELLEWNELSYKTPISSSKIVLEWLTTYLLVGNNWILKREDVQAAYDGTLFYRLREQNKHSRSLHQPQQSKKKKLHDYSNINISGLKLPKTYILQLETQLNNILHFLPKSTVTKVESQFRNSVHFIKNNTSSFHNPVLNGVATTTPTSFSTKNAFNVISRGFSSFMNNSNNDNSNNNMGGMGMDHDHNYNGNQPETSYLVGSLTGVLAINLLDQQQTMNLTGVKGYQQPDYHQKNKEEEQLFNDETEDDDSDNDYINGNNDYSILTGIVKTENDTTKDDEKEGNNNNDYYLGEQMTGIKPEGADYYSDHPQTNWLRTNKLTGVPSYHSIHNIEEEEEEDNDNEEEFEDEDDDDDSVFNKTKIDHFISPITTGILLSTTTSSDDDDDHDRDHDSQKDEDDVDVEKNNNQHDNEKYVNKNKNNEKNNKSSIPKQESMTNIPSSSFSSSSSSQDEEFENDSPISPTLEAHQEALKKIESNNEWQPLNEVSQN